MSRMYTRFAAMLVLAFLPVAFGLASFAPATAQDTEESSSGGSLPIFGILQGDEGDVGTFQGTVSGLVASEGDGEVVLDGLVSGLAVIDDETVRITDQEFSSVTEPSVAGSVNAEDYVPGGQDGEESATPAGSVGDEVLAFSMQTATDPGKCDVLYLNIEPITLNLLGLEVLTSPITIDVNAIPGEGNLLGNLVCSLAGLLDGTPDAIGELTDQLNQILSGVGVAPVDADVTDETAPGTPDATTEPTEETTDVTEEATDSTDDATEEATEEEEETSEATEEDEDPVLIPDDSDSTPDN